MHVVMVFHYDPAIRAADDHVCLTLVDGTDEQSWDLDDPEGRDMIAAFISLLNRTRPDIVTEALAYFN